MSPKNGSWRVLPVTQHASASGTLGSFQYGDELDFEIKRIYFISEVSHTSARGNHAHLNLRQCIMAVGGSLRIELESAKGSKTILLKPLVEILILEGLVWRRIYFESPGTICLVGASETYTEEDYVRDYERFKALTEEK